MGQQTTIEQATDAPPFPLQPPARPRQPGDARRRVEYQPELFDRRQVIDLLCISSHLLDDLMERGVFPRPIKLARKCVRWKRAAVLAAIDRLGSEAQSEQ